MANADDIQRLITAWMAGQLDAHGIQELERALRDPLSREECLTALEALMTAEPTVLLRSRESWDHRVEAILSLDREQEPAEIPGIDSVRRVSFWRRGLVRVVVAVVVALLGLGVWWMTRLTDRPVAPVVVNTHDLPPGGNHAVLVLGGGQRIVLDSVRNGQLAQQGGAVINKLANGRLVYARQGTEAVLYNTLTTPRGGKYQLTLPDGSKVWLNAASSITYPTAFISRERRVMITGEAYLEVVADAGKPFIVTTGGVETEVLGTSFDVNSYTEEGWTRVTLVTGRVRVKDSAASRLLRPGQQAVMGQPGWVDPKADLETVLAWKNGYFNFKGADLGTIMRELQRWYDFKVVYAYNVEETFHIEMSRNTNLSNVFRILEGTGGVHFKIEGKVVTVVK